MTRADASSVPSRCTRSWIIGLCCLLAYGVLVHDYAFALDACEEARTPARKNSPMTPEWMGFAPFPGARPLCAEHVSGRGMHVEWYSFATSASSEDVVAFYRAGTRARELQVDGPGQTKLAVFPASDASRYPSCAEHPTAAERTVILVSRAIR